MRSVCIIHVRWVIFGHVNEVPIFLFEMSKNVISKDCYVSYLINFLLPKELATWYDTFPCHPRMCQSSYYICYWSGLFCFITSIFLWLRFISLFLFCAALVSELCQNFFKCSKLFLSCLLPQYFHSIIIWPFNIWNNSPIKLSGSRVFRE